MPEKTRRLEPIIKICPVCKKEFTLALSAKKSTRCCGSRCSRHFFHYNNLEDQRQKAREWYERNRESEIQKNRAYRKQNKELFDWYHNKERFDGLRQSILKRDDFKCRVCGSIKTSIHHIDGRNFEKESPNNHPENLITLCNSCHHKLHWWQRKNYNLTSGEDIVRTMAKVIEAGGKSLR